MKSVTKADLAFICFDYEFDVINNNRSKTLLEMLIAGSRLSQTRKERIYGSQEI